MIRRFALSLVLPTFLLAAWQLAASGGFLSAAYFPAPLRTFDALWRLVTTGALWDPLGATSLRMLEGWLLASILGIGLGSLIGSSRTAMEYLQPLVEFLRPLPASAIIPAAILLFGLSNDMALFVIAFGSIWPVLLGTLHGITAIEPRLKEVSAILEMPPASYLYRIAIPGAQADIFTGMRISLAVALILAVVVEMQAAQPGLGQNILLAQRMYRSPELYAGIVVLGAFGVCSDRILTAIETRLMRWKHV
jgi:ABC-type nitrate/sulfonate/bicarbonate transport system permease component